MENVYFRETSSFESDIWKYDCRCSFFRNLVLSYLMHAICSTWYAAWYMPKTHTRKIWTNSEGYGSNQNPIRINRFTDKRLFSTFCCHFLVIKMIKRISITNLANNYKNIISFICYILHLYICFTFYILNIFVAKSIELICNSFWNFFRPQSFSRHSRISLWLIFSP